MARCTHLGDGLACLAQVSAQFSLSDGDRWASTTVSNLQSGRLSGLLTLFQPGQVLSSAD